MDSITAMRNIENIENIVYMLCYVIYVCAKLNLNNSKFLFCVTDSNQGFTYFVGSQRSRYGQILESKTEQNFIENISSSDKYFIHL